MSLTPNSSLLTPHSSLPRVAIGVHLSLLDRPLAPGPVRIAQLALVELAVRIARHRGDEVDRSRTLVLGHALVAEGENLVGQGLVWRDARRGLDHRLHGLAPVLVRDA